MKTLSKADGVAVTAILITGALLGGWVAVTGVVRAITRVVNPAALPVELLAEAPLDEMSAVLDRMQVTGAPLSTGAVWMLALGDFFGALGVGLVTAAFAYVLLRVVQGKPFHGSMRTASLVAGCAIVFGSLLSQALGGFGQLMAGTELGSPALPAFEFEPLPIIVGFAVLGLTYVFQAGTRLQKDVEGLV